MSFKIAQKFGPGECCKKIDEVKDCWLRIPPFCEIYECPVCGRKWKRCWSSNKTDLAPSKGRIGRRYA